MPISFLNEASLLKLSDEAVHENNCNKSFILQAWCRDSSDKIKICTKL